MGYQGDMWQELASITVQRLDSAGSVTGAKMNFVARAEEVGFSGGDKSISLKTLINGGNLVKFDPATMSELTIKIYPEGVSPGVTTGNADTKGMVTEFFGNGTQNATTTTISLARHNFKVWILFKDGAVQADASDTVTGKYYRIIYNNSYLTDIAPSFDDKEYSNTIKFDTPPFTRAAVGNITHESSD